MVLWLAILGFLTHRGVYHLPNSSRLVSYQGHRPSLPSSKFWHLMFFFGLLVLPPRKFVIVLHPFYKLLVLDIEGVHGALPFNILGRADLSMPIPARFLGCALAGHIL